MKIVEVLTKQELLKAVEQTKNSDDPVRIFCKENQLTYFIPGKIRRDISSIGYAKLSRKRYNKSVSWSEYRTELIENIKKNIK